MEALKEFHKKMNDDPIDVDKTIASLLEKQILVHNHNHHLRLSIDLPVPEVVQTRVDQLLYMQYGKQVQSVYFGQADDATKSLLANDGIEYQKCAY